MHTDAWSWSRIVSLEARAPGYAWQPVSVDLLAGGDHWIDVAVAEAVLVMTVRMPADSAPQRMQLSERGGWRREFEVTTDGHVIALGGLAPGRYELATLHSEAGAPERIERASLELVAGDRRQIRIDLGAEQRGPARPLSPAPR